MQLPEIRFVQDLPAAPRIGGVAAGPGHGLLHRRDGGARQVTRRGQLQPSAGGLAKQDQGVAGDRRQGDFVRRKIGREAESAALRRGLV